MNAPIDTPAPSNEIQEVFGQFAIELEGNIKLFGTLAEAQEALSAAQNGAEQLQIAREYAEARGLRGKNAQGKINVIVDFLRWVDVGRPGLDVAMDDATDSEPVETFDDTIDF